MNELRRRPSRDPREGPMSQAHQSNGRNGRSTKTSPKSALAAVSTLALERSCDQRAALPIERDDVEEIFADVCLNLLRDDMHKLRAYRAERGSKLGSWVGLIAINTAYDYLRGVARRPRLDRLDTAPEAPTLALSPLEVLCE